MSMGTNIFCLGFNLASSEHQSTLIQQLKSRGDEVIQTASGLCVKTALSAAEMEAFVRETATDGIKIEKIDAGTDRKTLAPDVVAFLGDA
jgi:DNA-binding protein